MVVDDASTLQLLEERRVDVEVVDDGDDRTSQHPTAAAVLRRWLPDVRQYTENILFSIFSQLQLLQLHVERA